MIVESTTNPRIASMMEMLIDVSRCTDPNDAVHTFSQRVSALRPQDGVLAVSQRNLAADQYKVTRQVGVDDFPRTTADPMSVNNPWEQWHQLKTFTGGFIGEHLAEGKPKLITSLDVADDPVLRTSISRFGSCVIVPVFDHGEPLNWLFHFRLDANGYDLDDLEQMLLTGNLFGSMTRNLVSVQRAERLLDEVRRVQRSLLPHTTPDIPGTSISEFYESSEQAGGDYYDFFDMGDGRWGVLIADVSGHGPGAATVMAMLHGILHSYHQLNNGNPASILKYANDRLLNANMQSNFVTAVFGILDPEHRTFTYSCAGHPRPRVKDTVSGEVRTLDAAATLPLGIMELDEFPEATEQITPGETLILYTDGITEEFDPSGTDMFGTDGLDNALAVCSGQPYCVIDTVQTALRDHTGRHTRKDDQTIVVIHINKT